MAARSLWPCGLTFTTSTKQTNWSGYRAQMFAHGSGSLSSTVGAVCWAASMRRSFRAARACQVSWLSPTGVQIPRRRWIPSDDVLGREEVQRRAASGARRGFAAGIVQYLRNRDWQPQPEKIEARPVRHLRVV